MYKSRQKDPPLFPLHKKIRRYRTEVSNLACFLLSYIGTKLALFNTRTTGNFIYLGLPQPTWVGSTDPYDNSLLYAS